MLCADASTFGGRIKRATIVTRKSGAGYRLVVGLETESGTRMPETLQDVFESPAAARLFALRELGLSINDIRVAHGVEPSARLRQVPLSS